MSSKKRSFEISEFDNYNNNNNNFEKKIKNEEINDLDKIVILLENINLRLEKCEQNIAQILYAQNLFFEEQKKKNQHDEEIYNSYIN
jgi:hypothetical protein